MDINYYDEHQEEFEAVKQALKGKMEKIWGSMLKDSGDNLDDEATYLNLFEELQYTFSPSSFSELTPSQDLDEDKIAAFVARTRSYKHGITLKCRPGRQQKWLKGRIKPLEDAEGTNLCWIDTATIVHIGAGQQFDAQYYLTVTTLTGQSYRVNEFRLPGRLLEVAQESLFWALDSTTGGSF
ncbi:TPA: hypothetical protein U0V61_004363 [Escherichia coli]|nr:hypothetical protein [Escherichia coli]MED9634495.1 hypothetical protein [Escherichia marmotae]MED8996952.1 hypothetical protein [Escherichia coli]HEL7977816.1 hypothetical protein [Escherichia coli]HEL7987516.1 hypothetical protein [Escherichia coli]